MMKLCSFTIVARNYIGLAKILRESYIKYSDNSDFFIFVADATDEELEEGILSSKEILAINESKWIDMSFKYNLTEFCTSIKPYCFQYLFNNLNYDVAMYFDPDIYFFSPLTTLIGRFKEKSIILTPHITTPEIDDIENHDVLYLNSGIYNLGFIGVKKDSNTMRFIDWWANRLDNECFNDSFKGTFTDQKWMDLATSFIPIESIYVERGLGYNIAPWNFSERKLSKENDVFEVVNRVFPTSKRERVVFVHFSGFNYSALLNKKVERGRIENCRFYQDAEDIIEYYSNELKTHEESFLEYFHKTYLYSVFTDGTKIDLLHRRIYRMYSRYNTVDNPFDAAGDFCRMIKKNKLVSQNKVDSLPLSSVTGVSRKTRVFFKLLKAVKIMIGYDRYLKFLKLMKYASRLESQILLVDNVADEEIIYTV